MTLLREGAAEKAGYLPLEIASGTPLRRRAITYPVDDHRSARRVLEDLVLDAVRSERCFVAFSGGRDSSAILAVAVHVARREGLPLPVPLTKRFPGLPRADESTWQMLVLEHLGVPSAELVEVTDQQMVLGERARRSVRRHGALIPPTVHAAMEFERAQGGHLLTGEGGDSAIGPRPVTPWNLVRLDRRLQGSNHLRELGVSLLATDLRVVRPLAARRSSSVPWLVPEAQRAVRAAVVRSGHGPLRFDRWTESLIGHPVVRAVDEATTLVARDHEVVVSHPFQTPSFLAALARDGGRWGYRGRTDMMRRLFADLLPDAVLARTSKASFNGSLFGDREREFARGWDGSGVDPTLVDVERLRAEWLGENPALTSATPLHAAWLASQGLPLGGES